MEIVSEINNVFSDNSKNVLFTKLSSIVSNGFRCSVVNPFTRILKIKGCFSPALVNFSSKLKSFNGKSLDTRFDKTGNNNAPDSVSDTDSKGCGSKLSPPLCDIINSPLGLQPSMVGEVTEYHLVVEDNEYSFFGSKVSDDCVKSLWNKLSIKDEMPNVTVLFVLDQTITEITQNPIADSYITALIPKLNNFLILFSDTKEFEDILYRQLLLMWSYSRLDSKGKELEELHRELEARCKSPKLMIDDKVYF